MVKFQMRTASEWGETSNTEPKSKMQLSLETQEV